MKRRLLVREKDFIALVESYLLHKESGNESNWLRALRKKDPELADIWSKTENQLLKFLIATRDNIIQNGGSTIKIDSQIRKLGYKI